MCGDVGLGAAVENLEELGDLLDRGRRVVYFGAQGIHETIGEIAVRINVKHRHRCDHTYRSARLISSIGSSSEGSCTLLESTKPSSVWASAAVPESAEPRLSNTSGPFSCPSLLPEDRDAVLESCSSVGDFTSELPILVNDCAKCSEGPDILRPGAMGFYEALIARLRSRMQLIGLCRSASETPPVLA